MRILTALLTMFFTCALLFGGGALYVRSAMEGPGPLVSNKTVIIPRGSSALSIAAELEKNDVIISKHFFRLRYYMDGKPELKAGEYAFLPGQKLQDVMTQIAQGRVVPRNFTVPEGLTVREILNLLTADTALTGQITDVPAEGSLLPETYRYSYGDDRNLIVIRMEKAMADALADAWAKRAPDVPLASPQELLTLASIVEKETGIAAERPRVAGVFVNRLLKKMMLQTDPTVSYGITMGQAPLGRNLTYADLQKPTPYNTYTIPALPPGPIANPGRASLMAAAQPEKNEFIYFVADGTGGHRFAVTIEEHNKNVAYWRGINKK